MTQIASGTGPLPGKLDDHTALRGESPRRSAFVEVLDQFLQLFPQVDRGPSPIVHIREPLWSIVTDECSIPVIACWMLAHRRGLLSGRRENPWMRLGRHR